MGHSVACPHFSLFCSVFEFRRLIICEEGWRIRNNNELEKVMREEDI
jgi:hypothetical protein